MYLEPRESLSACSVGAARPIGDSDLLPAYRRWDVRFAYDFRLGAQRGQAALVVHNIFKSYNEYRNDNLFKSRVLATLNMEF